MAHGQNDHSFHQPSNSTLENTLVWSDFVHRQIIKFRSSASDGAMKTDDNEIIRLIQYS